MLTLNTQVFVLLYSFFSGMLFGAMFDIYKIILGTFSSKLFSFLKDFLFWMLIGLLMFCFLLYTQYAIISFYTCFYIFFGIVFYLKVISRFLFPLLRNFMNKFLAIVRILFKNVFYFAFSIFGKKNNKSL